MLVSLHIRDFILITGLDLEFAAGFTTLTGETGAGKSVVLSALEFALGRPARSGSTKSLVRNGAERTSVAACFEPGADTPIWDVLNEAGVQASVAEGVVLKRIAMHAGGARAFINDQPVSAKLLSEIGAQFIEFHGQHAGQALLSPAAHGDLLDAYARCEPQRRRCAHAWSQWRAASDAHAALARKSAAAQTNRADLKAALDDIDALAPEAEEAARLAAERSVLQAADHTLSALAQAEAMLDGQGAEGRLAAAAKTLARAAAAPALSHAPPGSDLAQKLEQACEAVERALIETSEAAETVRAAQAAGLSSPQDLEHVETRLFALRALGRKHGVNPDQLPDLRKQIAESLDLIETEDAALAAAGDAEAAAEQSFRDAAAALSERRQAAARRLERAMRREIRPLKLGDAQFRVRVDAAQNASPGPKGWDDIAFETAMNGDSMFAPLMKTISGGEMSRFALALRVCLANAGGAPTLIFDEADAGVGGATAAAIGARMGRLARDRQVLAVTHSPQVAAAADAQWRIAKTRRRGREETILEDLTPTDRSEEIARMLAGAEITREARAAADRLLARH